MAAQGSAAGRGCLGGARRSRGGLRISSIQSRIETACNCLCDHDDMLRTKQGTQEVLGVSAHAPFLATS